MSEGRLGSGLWPGRASPDGHYTPGEEPAHLGLCLHLVEKFLAMDAIHMTVMDGDIECSPEDLTEVDHAQAFLDTLVGMLAGEAEPRYVRECSHLFTPVLNALYGCGHNSLVLDLRELPNSPETVARDLHGRKEDPLDITCYLRDGARVFGAGGHAYDSRVTFTGATGAFGHGSADSEFVLHGNTEFMGASSRRCTYFIPHAGEASLVGAKVEFSTVYDLFFRWAKEETRPDSGPSKATMSSSGILTDRASLVHLGSDFFKRGNTILVPDGEGGWTEVRP